METVVDTEIFERLIPILSAGANSGVVLDLQDILQRFAFDNICNIAFGYDPGYLLPSLPPAPFAEAFEESVSTIGAFLEKIKFSFEHVLHISWVCSEDLAVTHRTMEDKSCRRYVLKNI